MNESETTNSVDVVRDSDDFFGSQETDSTSEVERRDRELHALRRYHFTAGVREGANSAREAHLQSGFDEGFADGAKAVAEAGFLLGACSILDAFFGKCGCDSRSRISAQHLGDSEVLTRDLVDIRESAAQLRARLRNLPVDADVRTESARLACERVSIVHVPDYTLRQSSRENGERQHSDANTKVKT